MKNTRNYAEKMRNKVRNRGAGAFEQRLERKQSLLYGVLRARESSKIGGTIVIIDDSPEDLPSMNDPTRWKKLKGRCLLINTLVGTRCVVVV